MHHLCKLQKNKIVIRGELTRDSLCSDGWSMLTSDERAQLNHQPSVVLDFSEVTSVDSAGLAWVLNWLRDAAKNGVNLVCENSPSSLIQLARLSNVESLIPIAENKDDQ